MSDTLKYKNYIGSIEYNEEDNLLFGKVQGLSRVLISYEGKSIDELKQDFIDGVEHYLESCKEQGTEPQKSYTGSFNVRIPSDIHAMAVIRAKKLGINLNAFVKSAIEDKLQTSSNKRQKRETAKH